MPQVKIYGLRTSLEKHREDLSKAIHQALMSAFGMPEKKRFQRFIALEPEGFIFPEEKSQQYTIIEVSMFQGRSIEAKKQLIKLLYTHVHEHTGIANDDIEITLFETPMENWGLRGLPGDELMLSYQVKV